MPHDIQKVKVKPLCGHFILLSRISNSRQFRTRQFRTKFGIWYSNAESLFKRLKETRDIISYIVKTVMICFQLDFCPFHQKNNFCLICVSSGQKKFVTLWPKLCSWFWCDTIFLCSNVLSITNTKTKCIKVFGKSKELDKNQYQTNSMFWSNFELSEVAVFKLRCTKFYLVNRHRRNEFSNLTTNTSCKCIKHFQKMSFHFFLIFHILKFLLKCQISNVEFRMLSVECRANVECLIRHKCRKNQRSQRCVCV